MGKIFNFLKKYSFGAFRTGLYSSDGISFASFLSVILSGLFLIGLFIGISLYFYEFFIVRQTYLIKQETKRFSSDNEIFSFSLP